MSRKPLFVLMTVALVAAPFVAVEVVVRLVAGPVSTLPLFVSPGDQDQNKRDSAIFDGDPLLGWRLKPNLADVWWDYTFFSTNGDRIRYPNDLDDKPAGRLRVVTLGDSVTFGYRVPVSFSKSRARIDAGQIPYPAILERRLRYDGVDAAVIPLAVPGYTSRQGRLWFERAVDDYAPDLVTILYGWNDTDKRPLPDAVTFPDAPWGTLGRRIVAGSAALTKVAVWGRARMTGGEAPPYETWGARVETDDYVANIVAMARRAKEKGAAVVVILPVYRDAVTNRWQAERIGAARRGLAAACEKEGITTLLVPELTEAGHPANERLFGEVIHPNAVGHRLLADRLYPVVRRLLEEASGEARP